MGGEYQLLREYITEKTKKTFSWKCYEKNVMMMGDIFFVIFGNLKSNDFKF